MNTETLWIPAVGDYVNVPSPGNPKERTVMAVGKRVQKDGLKFLQCGEYLYPLDDCLKPQWIPQPRERVRATICRYEGTVRAVFVQEQGYVMADCIMYRKPNGKPVEHCFRDWSTPICLLEPM